MVFRESCKGTENIPNSFSEHACLSRGSGVEYDPRIVQYRTRDSIFNLLVGIINISPRTERKKSGEIEDDCINIPPFSVGLQI